MSTRPPIKLVIGVTGLKAAGKDVICERLALHGFGVYRLSDPLRVEAAKRGIQEPTVARLQDLGNEGRRKGGPGYWAERLLDMAKERGHALVAVNGIRNPGEIEILRKENFVLVGVVAPILTRAARFLNRDRVGDPPTLEGFLQVDDRDRGVGEPLDGQQVDKCIAQVAQENLYNNAGSPEEFVEWTKDFLEKVAVPAVEAS